tara:strand:+ start:1696 stop:9069 length:7374 start_codon:yes stop_codon:yes gene_type:complete
MPQQTNLNISPYYDDFNRTDNYHRVLFKPGFPVQARELTSLQSIMQNQIEQFGSHMFKEGSVVIPGGVTYDGNYFAVRLDATHLGTDVEVYIKDLVGKRIKGQTSGITAKIINFIPASTSISSDPTLYVKYRSPGPSGSFDFFSDSELLILEEPVTYGNTTLNTGSSIASTISQDSCLSGSAANIQSGVYFVRGSFVRVNQQTLILDQYDNQPFYRVGLQVVEKTINAKEDAALYDNAKGFSNYAAPGADRLKIDLVLAKKFTDDFDDTDFIELIRIRAGNIEKQINRESQYNLIRDYFAKRTFDESGDYTTTPFFVTVLDSLNDRMGSEGIYYATESTRQGNTPSDDLACVRISPGTAYVKGYEFETMGETIDCVKPRTTSDKIEESFSFRIGNRLKLDGVQGITTFRNPIDLQSGISSEKIGDAKVYNFALSDAKYKDNSTEFDAYLYDVQLYTKLFVNDNVSNDEVVKSAYVEGAESGATGYTIAAGAGSSTITLTQVSGHFQAGERIKFRSNENLSRVVDKVIAYNMNNVENVQQSNTFYAKKVLNEKIPYGLRGDDPVRIATNGDVTCVGRTFERFKPGDIIIYRRPGQSLPNRNVVSYVANDGGSMRVAALTTNPNLFTGSLPGSQYEGPIFIGEQQLSNEDAAGLYLPLPQKHIADIDFTGAQLILSDQVTGESTDANGTLVVNSSSLTIDDCNFVSFDQERYQVQYSSGLVATITEDQVTVTDDVLTFSGLAFSESNIKVNVTVAKSNIKSKVKEYKRSQEIEIVYSSKDSSGTTTGSSVDDGLTPSGLYGIRVQDEEICLNFPDVAKVAAVYESLDKNKPILDQLVFSSTDPIFQNAIVGETIVGENSNSVAIIVSVNAGTSSISIVYKTTDKFQLLETLLFQESNSSATLQGTTPGKYNDVTDAFTLDQGQREQYYDYSRLLRINDGYIPSRKLLVVLDRYEIPSADTGDVFTVNSYDAERFKKDIPGIGKSSKRATDTLDFRPRVVEFTPSSAAVSPFFPSNRDTIQSGNRIPTPNENSRFKYKHYLGRMDKVLLKSTGNIIVHQGEPSVKPVPPADDPGSMVLATIAWPPFLYQTSNARVFLIDNRRYTMRDIGAIEDRVENLENVTSLSLLEQKVATLQVKDADGLDRFKSGFFADSLKSRTFVDVSSPIDIDSTRGHMRPLTDLSSIDMQVLPATQEPPETLDFSQDFALLDGKARKTGRMITLDYKETAFVEQNFATRVENLNPFLVYSYIGDLKLSPTSDNWINTHRTQTLQTQVIRRTSIDPRVAVTNVDGGFGDDELQASTQDSVQKVERDDITSRNTFIASEEFDPFIRSRNIEYDVNGLRPNARFFTFFDELGNVDVVPKVIGISNVVGAFTVGETITALVNGETYRFRLCRPDHKKGPFAAPTMSYEHNPLDREETLPVAYSQGSTVINIDTTALASAPQGDFFGYLPIGTVVSGESSGAQATIADLGLFSDNYGDLRACVWVRDPFASPAPLARVRTGEREFKVSSSSVNATGLRGSTAISAAQAIYTAVGTTRIVQTDVSVTTLETTTIQRDISLTFVNRRPPPPPPPPAPVIINNTRVIDRTRTFVDRRTIDRTVTVQQTIDNTVTQVVDNTRTIIQPVPFPVPAPPQAEENDDPLAQSFKVDQYGAYITSVDVYFATMLDPEVPAFVELRTMELGTPTTKLVSPDARVILTSNDINLSTDASVATKATFSSPIYLEPATEYAIVVGAPTNTYEVFTAEMGQTALNAQDLPSAAGRVYANQFSVGSLFKSQNASTWTPCQFEDLCFKLYRAEFIHQDAVVTFQNPPIRANNGILPVLNKNPIHALPKKAALGITTTTNAGLIGTVFVPGRKVGDASANYRYGYIESTGGPVKTGGTLAVGISTNGLNYGTPSSAAVATYAITGQGAGLKLGVTVGTGNSGVTAVTIQDDGQGYQVGDIVGIVTAEMSGSGSGARIGINSLGGLDTLYLTNVQAEEFGNAASVNYYHDLGTLIDSGLDVTRYDETGSVYTGEYAKLSYFNHGMYGTGNKVAISGVSPNTLPTTTATIVNSTSNSISIADSTGYNVYEGVIVSAANTGYAILNNEIISYTAVGVNTLSGITRGVNNTQSINHAQGSNIQKYEFAGIGLGKINTEHSVEVTGRNMDDFMIKIDREGRTTDISGLSQPQLSFNADIHGGGAHVHASKNIQYDTITPVFDITVPGPTDTANLSVRTVSGTSIDGEEASFVDQGFESYVLNQPTKLSSTRIVASEANENARLTNLFRNRSLTARVAMNNGGNFHSSPMICLDTMAFKFSSNRLNKPIGDDAYASDPRANVLFGDQHTSYYVSKPILIKQPATSLQVIFDAFRPASTDFRVLYSLIRGDASEVDQKFVLFPGYLNSVDTTGNGFGDTPIDTAKNDGRPDKFINPGGEFREYQYSINDLEPYTGFVIKVVFNGTNQAEVPVLKNIRALALA